MNKLNGIILAGGQSSRMGSDKALIKIEDKTIIEIMIDKLKPFYGEIIISANDVDSYSKFGCRVIPDKFINAGPLAGIYSALSESEYERSFIISCDLPLVSNKLIDFLIKYDSGREIFLPVALGEYHQLCGIYSKSILETAEEILQDAEEENEADQNKKNTSIRGLLEKCDVDFIDVSDLTNVNEFLNMNTREDFAIIEKLLSKTN